MPGMYAINTVNGMALAAGGQLGYPMNGYAPRTLGKSDKRKRERVCVIPDLLSDMDLRFVMATRPNIQRSHSSAHVKDPLVTSGLEK